ncbi:MAG: hypothetical protein V3T45_07875 [Nitrospinaceae bacterium]
MIGRRFAEVRSMKVGDIIKFDFAGKKKEGMVAKLFPNSVHLKVDFERDKGKIIKRKLSEVGAGIDKGKKTKK